MLRPFVGVSRSSIAGDTLPPSRLAPGQFERNECIVISETPHEELEVWSFHSSSTTPMTIQRTGLFSSPTALRAAEPSLEITTRWCRPAPWASMAICGTPSGSPAWLIGWQITSRQPTRLGCLRVATTLPSTRANSIREIRNPKVETRRKSEIRNPNGPAPPIHHARISGFGVLSGLGFRRSGLSPLPPDCSENEVQLLGFAPESPRLFSQALLRSRRHAKKISPKRRILARRVSELRPPLGFRLSGFF